MQLHKSCTWIETARLYLTEAVCFSDSARTFCEDVLEKEIDQGSLLLQIFWRVCLSEVLSASHWTSAAAGGLDMDPANLQVGSRSCGLIQLIAAMGPSVMLQILQGKAR